ncbi:MAG: hypothetical protein NXI10_09560 [bacterium]|nr:hypothetical protein [bacterium]
MNLYHPKTFLNTLLYTLISLTAFSQLPVPKTSQVQYEGKTRPSLEVTLVPEAKEVKQAWHDFIKEQYEVDMKGIGWFSNKEVLTAEEVQFDELSTKTIDFHTKVVASKDGTRMEVFAAKGYDIFIDPEEHPKEFARMDLILRDFLASYIPAYYSEKVEEQQGEVEDVAEKREDQEEDIVDNKEEIALLSEEIIALEEVIKKGEYNLQSIEKDLDEEREKLRELKAKLEEVKGQ